MKLLHHQALTVIAACGILASPASALMLHDGFIAGDGSGITYTTGSLGGQSGGTGWEPDSTWTINGANVNINLNAGNYAEFVQGSTGSTRTRQIRRQYADPGLSAFEIHTTVELAGLTGIAEVLDTAQSPTLHSDSIAREYFAIFDRNASGNVQSSVPWYLEASAGFWHALPGTGGPENFGDPAALAPIVEGETYEIRLLFPGNNTWGVEIDMLNAGQSFSVYDLPFIGTNTEETFSRFLVLRARYAGDTDHVNEPFDIRVHNLSMVPEPSTYALILGFVVLLGAAGLRRLRRPGR